MTINIPADQASIQSGINAASNGDTVLVQPGTYVENINFNGKNIVLGSLYLSTLDTAYIAQTIIDGDSSGSVIIFESGEDSTTVLNGFTITNGSAYQGGGIQCYNSSPSLMNLIIHGNSAEFGGGIGCIESQSQMVHVTIRENTAHYNGGGLYISVHSTLFLNQVSISNNSVDSTYNGSRGGGISLDHYSTLNFIDGEISGNSAYAGGGIYSYESHLNLSNTSVRENEAKNQGGGIYSGASMGSLLQSVTVSDNVVQAVYSAHGGGLYIGGNTVLVDVDISRNSAICSDESQYSSMGGGLSLSGSPSLSGVVIQNNYADKGGGIYLHRDASPTFSDVTIRENIASEFGGGLSFGSASSPSFDPENHCNIYLNQSSLGNDLYRSIYDTVGMDLYLDTFTVMQPSDYHAFPLSRFSFDILNGKLVQGDHDLYVAPNGDDMHSGQSPDDPLRSLTAALARVLADSLHQNTIVLADGIYSPSTTGEFFPLGMPSYVSLSGNTETGVILDAEERSNVLLFDHSQGTTLEKMTITGGFARYGGGIYCSYSNPTLKKITLSWNVATSSGGGIYCYDSNPLLFQVSIIHNAARWWQSGGGGIFVHDSSPYLVNVTIAENEANRGGGLYSTWASNPVLVNSILWNGGQQEIYLENRDYASITIAYSDIQGGQSDIEGTVNWLEGNIDTDPQFVDTENGDFRLQLDSPCVSGGTSASVDAGASFYLWDGDTLIDLAADEYFGTAPDMGAIENPPAELGLITGQVYHVAVTGSDTNDGSASYPMATIQHAIDTSSCMDTVMVHPGTYVENLILNDKRIVLGSLYVITGDRSYITRTVIDGGLNGSVMRLENIENQITEIRGLTLTNGNGTLNMPSVTGNVGGGLVLSNSHPILDHLIITDNHVPTSYFFGYPVGAGGGVYCYNSSPIFSHVVISNNSAPEEGAMFCKENSSPIFMNSTIVNNRATHWTSGGITGIINSHTVLINSIMWNNQPFEIDFSSLYDEISSVTIIHSDIMNGLDRIDPYDRGVVHWLAGNMDAYPLFMDSLAGDFSLRLESPCIDAGTAFFSLAGDTLIDRGFLEYWGSAPDVGAYESKMMIVYPGDTDNNGTVDVLDILPIGVYFKNSGPQRADETVHWEALQAQEWSNPAAAYADVNGDGIIDEGDVIGIGVNWGNTHQTSSPRFVIDPADSLFLSKHQPAFEDIYHSLYGDNPAVSAMRTLLRSILDIDTPLNYSLAQNFPNPFNPKTSIRFELPEAQEVSMRVYNLVGQEVMILLSHEKYPPGTYMIDLDASELSSGIYFYRIQAGKWTATHKLIVIK